MAIYGSLGEVNIGALSATTADNAVDVFVYDTRKDSDGGQWRKRTQYTSWYNETLNTATRGSRREFPAVAVIVATADNVTIYDGDDPDIPMWMVFTNSGAVVLNWATGGGCNVTTIFALNGILCIGKSVSACLFFNFVKDDIRLSYNQFNYSLTTGRLLIDRNNSNSGQYISSGDGYLIIGAIVNDITMTVLPNAPIDSATGLPVPTIALATNAGVSVIKDDGTIFNGGGFYHSTGISLSQDRTILYTTRVQDPCKGIFLSGNNFALSMSGGNSFSRFSSINISGNLLTDTIGDSGGDTTSIPQFIKPFGLGFVNYNTSSPTNSLVAYVTTSHNTGWMHGDIKGAWLSDTSTASVTGTELITNGTFSTSDLSAWTTIAGGTATVTGGLLKLTDTEGAFCYASAPFATVIGKQYVVSVDIVNNSNTAGSHYIRIGHSHNGTQNHDVHYGSSYGTKIIYFTATATTTYLTLISGLGVGTFGHWDNVSVRLAEADRSVNNKGLAIYGTITKTPVATGSNLVAYGGFDASNYLYQPHSASLSFGTNDFCVMYWYQNIAGDEINIQKNTRGADGWRIVPGNVVGDLYIANGNFSTYGALNGISNKNVWNHWAIIRKYNVGWHIYKNGVLVGNIVALSGNNFNEISPLTVGSSTATSNLMSLLRISQSVPSPEQIKKIYEDEKVLFQSNSQATLFGSSDAVTALAYDDTTSLLHVGTSSGRSEFKGLKRVDNTTTAVITSISASNGLVAEQ